MLDTVYTMYSALQEEADLACKKKFMKNAVSQEKSAEIAKERFSICTLSFSFCISNIKLDINSLNSKVDDLCF